MNVKVDEKYYDRLNSIEKKLFEGVLEVIQFCPHESFYTTALVKNESGHLGEINSGVLVVVEDIQPEDDCATWRKRAEDAEHIIKRADCFLCGSFRANRLEQEKK